VIRHRLETVVVALLALHVAVGPGADRVRGRLLLAHALEVLLRDDVLIADVLREERRHDPLPRLEVHHDRELVGRLDALEVVAEEVGRAAERVGLVALLDGELDVLGSQLSVALVERHTGPQLEGPRAHLVGGLPLGGQPRAVLPRLRIAHDERVVDAVPQRLLGLDRAPGERRFCAPLADGDDEAITLGEGARGQPRSADQRCGDGSRALQKGPPVDPSAHARSTGVPAMPCDMSLTVKKITSCFADLDFTRVDDDNEWYGRTRGRVFVTGELGPARAVLAIEIDATYGLTGVADNATQNQIIAGTGGQHAGASGAFDLNTDVVNIIEVKWLYVEFPIPGLPTQVRVGAQPFATTYKLGVLATGDFAGINLVTTFSPDIRWHLTYAQIEERPASGIGTPFPNGRERECFAPLAREGQRDRVRGSEERGQRVRE
jgi:hypothetical protein